jgi:hypothetical protein
MFAYPKIFVVLVFDLIDQRYNLLLKIYFKTCSTFLFAELFQILHKYRR